MTSPLLEGLNEIQREAVLHTEGPVLIVAGAGSGKTRALTHRIAYLVREQGVSPFEILAITFTNKASREMASRVEQLIGSGVARGMWVLTFHSACARILRREHTHLGIPSAFTIYDDGDTERLIAGILQGPRHRREALPAQAACRGDRQGEGPRDHRGGLRHDVLELLRGDRGEGLRRLRDAQEGGRGARLRRPDHRDGAAVPRPPRRAAHLPGAVPLHPGRRVPGHLARPVRADQPAGRALRQRLRRGRRRPGRLLVAGRDDPEHPGLRARPPRRAGVPDGAELPLHRQHPGRRERADRAQRPAQAEDAVDRRRLRRAGRVVPRRTTSTRRRCSSRARSSACTTRRGSGSATSRSSTGRTRSPA